LRGLLKLMHIHPMRPRARIATLAAALVVLGGVACSALSSTPPPAPTTSPTNLKSGQPAIPAAIPAAAPVGGGVAVGAPAPAQPAVSDAATQRSAVAANSASSASALPDSSAQILDRMVIRTAQLTVEVSADMESALAQARQIATRGGGYVSASNTHVEKVNDQDRMVADLTLQVRSDAADSTLSDLRGLGKVTSETSGSQDITEEYVDLTSNLRNLQASETAILKLMDKASQIQDVLALQRELTNVRGQIERIQGRKTYLERRSDMATITLALRLPAPEATRTPTGWDPIAIAARGWQASLTVLRGVAEALIVVVAFSWWLIPFALLGAYIWQHRRRTPTAAATPPPTGPAPTAPAAPAQA
jgi:Domain of unknown function (DUF4349)